MTSTWTCGCPSYLAPIIKKNPRLQLWLVCNIAPATILAVDFTQGAIWIRKDATVNDICGDLRTEKICALVPKSRLSAIVQLWIIGKWTQQMRTCMDS